VQSVHRRTPQILSVTSPLCATALCAGERGCRGVCFGLFPRFHEKSDILIVVMQIATEEVHPQRLFKGHAGRDTRNLVLIHRTSGGQGVRENLEPLEDASDFSFQNRDVISHSQPDLLNINAEVVMNEFVSHPRYVLPRYIGVLRSDSFRQPFGCLADDFDLADYRILNQRVLKKACLVEAFRVRLDFRNGVADVLEIDRIVTLHRQPVAPSGCDRADRGSRMLP